MLCNKLVLIGYLIGYKCNIVKYWLVI